MTAGATPAAVHLQRPPKANVNESLIYAVRQEKKSVTTKQRRRALYLEKR